MTSVEHLGENLLGLKDCTEEQVWNAVRRLKESASPKTYNGWTNYETWNVALWIDNEEGSYRYWRAVTQECWDEARAKGVFTRLENARMDLAKRLQDEIEEGNPLGDQANLYSDILSAALQDVNWQEIADNWLEEIEKDEPEEDDETEDEDAD